MNEPNQPRSDDSDDTVRDLLVRLGRDLSGALESLLAEIHALDERIARDDGAAQVVELAYKLRTIVEPITAFAQLESTPPADELVRIDLRDLVTKVTSGPEVAASFRVSLRGDLGVSFDDRNRLEPALELCLRLLSRMTENKTPLYVHREVHEPSDRVVLTTELHKPEPVALALLKRTAQAVGARLETDGRSLTLGFYVGARALRDERGSGALAGPVLAFRRDENASAAEPEPAARAVIVVVDDEPAAQAYMGRLLELEGFEVVSCTTLEQALEAAHAYRPDLVILDRLQVDREDEDWLRRFRSEPAIGRTPLVLMQSAESDSLGLVSVSDIVGKPIDPNEVIATIERLTGTGSPPIVVIRDSQDDSKWRRCLEGQTRAVVASSVSEAERLLDAVTPKMLIVDVRHVDRAVALLEEVRRRGRGDRVPVVAVHGRLSKKARLRLDAVADARITYSELSRRSLEAMIHEVQLGDQRTTVGAG